MFNTKSRAMFTVGSACALAAGVFLTSDTQLNLATVITGVPKIVDECIASLSESNEGSTTDYEIIKTRLNSGSEKDYVLKGKTDDLCGSAGCIHQLCINQNNTGQIVPFAYAAETLIVKNTITSGMHDIQLQGKSTSNLQWDGARYIILQ